MIEERRHIRRGHLRRMPLPGKVDKALDPMNVHLLRSAAIVPAPNGVPHQFQQSRLLLGRVGINVLRPHNSPAHMVELQLATGRRNVLKIRKDDSQKKKKTVALIDLSS
jgi:hypothetical protein